MFYECIRYANLVLSVGLLFVCTMRITRDWRYWTHREKVVRVHLVAYLSVLAYGTVEALASGAKPGLRVVLLLAVHTSFALALARTRRDPA